MASIEQQATSENRQDIMHEQSRNASAPSPRESAAEPTLSKQIVEKPSTPPQLAKLGTQAQQGIRKIRTLNTRNTRILILAASGVVAGLVVLGIVRRRQKQGGVVNKIQNMRMQRNIQDITGNLKKTLNTLINNIKNSRRNVNKVVQSTKNQVQNQQPVLSNMREGVQKSFQNIKLPPLLRVVLLARIASLLNRSKDIKLQVNRTKVRNKAGNNLQSVRRASATALSRLRIFVAGITTGYTWVYLFGQRENREIVKR